MADRRATSGPAGLEPWVDRVTMTLPTIRAARQIVFLVAGAEKAAAAERAFAGPVSDETPASLTRLAPDARPGLPRRRRIVQTVHVTQPEQQPAPLDVLELDRPEQLKALGHPLRLKVLQVLGETGTPLTNRELAQRLNVDPGHLHFHVRMLNRAGLIERAEAAGREKPYRPVAKHLRVGPEIRATGLASDLQGAQLRELQRGFDLHAANGEFRSAQVHAKVDVETLRKLFRELLDTINEVEDERRAAADDHDSRSTPPSSRATPTSAGRRRQRRRFGQRAREAAAAAQPFEDERGVGHRYVFEVVGPRLERAARPPRPPRRTRRGRCPR